MKNEKEIFNDGKELNLQTIFKTVLTVAFPPFEKTWHEKVAVSASCGLTICNVPSARTVYLESERRAVFFLHSHVTFTVGSWLTLQGSNIVTAFCTMVVAFGPFVTTVGSKMRSLEIWIDKRESKNVLRTCSYYTEARRLGAQSRSICCR